MVRMTVKDVSVEYPVFSTRSHSLRLKLMHYGSAGRLAKDVKGHVSVSALQNVSFEVGGGDRVGLIGRNGAGKTTLLKLLGGVYMPTTGSVEIDGTVSSILNLGLNVDDELTGLEAVRYYCIMKGIQSEKIPEIEEDARQFTELGDYLHMPLRTYSAGMRTRLAFAVATSNSPDILLMDEGIGAGDQFFLERVRARTADFIESANLLMVASHSQGLLREICNKALVLDHGHVIAAGPIDDMFAVYNDLNRPPSTYPLLTIAPATEGAPDAPPVPPEVDVIASSETEENPALAAFDGSPLNYWRFEADSAVGDNKTEYPWLGLHFQTAVHPRSAFVRQRTESFGAETVARRVVVEVSEDGFKKDIRRAAVADMPLTGANVPIGLSDVGAGRWWRLRALTFPESGIWAVSHFDLSPHVLPDWHDGQAIASGSAAAGVGPANAFMQEHPHPWVSERRGHEVQGASWLGWDYDSNTLRAVRRVSLAQWDEGQQPNTVESVLLQGSNDGFVHDIFTVGVLELNGSDKPATIKIEDLQLARYWRVIANSGTKGGRWGVRSLVFESLEANDPRVIEAMGQTRLANDEDQDVMIAIGTGEGLSKNSTSKRTAAAEKTMR